MGEWNNIKKQIQQGLDARVNAMGTFGKTTLRSPALGTVSDQSEEFKLSRQAVESCAPYVRMIGGGPDESFYVMSGMFNSDSDPNKFASIDPVTKYTHTRASTSNLTGGEGNYELGKSEDIRDKKFGYKEPGITSVNMSFGTSGATGGALKQATVQFTVWQMSQMDIFQKYSFLSMGATVVLDWGWIRADKSVQAILEPPSIVKKEGDKLTLDFDLFKEVTDPTTGQTAPSDFSKMSENKYGDWDGLIGVITKVDWKINEEGGFNCEAVIQGKGVHAFGDPMPLKEGHNNHPPMESSYTGLRDLGTFKHAFYKATMKNEDLTKQEQESLGAASLDEAITKAKSGPEVSLPERIASLDVEIIMKLFPQLKNHEEVGKESEHQVAMSKLNEAAIIYKPFAVLDDEGKETGKYATGVLSQDKKTGEMYKNTNFGYDMWINWGWLEDNVVSYYGASFGENAKPSAVFRSITMDSDTTEGNERKIINRSITIKNDPHLYTFSNDFILPGSTPTDWMVPTIGDSKNPKDNPYKKLGELINEKAAPFTEKGHEYNGFLRHIYVNFNLIKSAFSNPGLSISGCMLALANMLNSRVGLWNFEIDFIEERVYKEDNIILPARYFLHDKRTPVQQYPPDRDPGKSYIFENNGLNSLVQSCDIATDISSRFAAAAYFGRETHLKSPVEKLLLQNNVAGPDHEDVMNMARFYSMPDEDGNPREDPLAGLMNENDSLSVALGVGGTRRKFYGSPYPVMNFENSDITAIAYGDPSLWDGGLEKTGWNHDINTDMKRLYPAALSARVDQMDQMLKQAIDQGQADVDVSNFKKSGAGLAEETQELNMYAFPPAGVDLSKLSENEDEAARNELVAKFPYQNGFDMQPMWLRTLEWYLNENPVTSLMHMSTKNEVTFLPITATLTIDGIGGIKLLDMFRLSYLPSLYKQEGETPGTYFIILGIENTIDADGWKTNIKGQIQIDWSRMYPPPSIAPGTEEQLRKSMEKEFKQLWETSSDEATETNDDKPKKEQKLPPPSPTLTGENKPEQISELNKQRQKIGLEPIGDGLFKIPKDKGPEAMKGADVNWRTSGLFQYDNLDQFMNADKLKIDPNNPFDIEVNE